MEFLPALLSHKEKVAQERQRINRYMCAKDPLTVRNWLRGRTTRRIALKAEQELLVWRTQGEVVCSVRIEKISASLECGFITLEVEVILQEGDKFQYGVITTDPWNLAEDMFVYVDAVEPLGLGEGYVNLIVRSGAGHEGVWPDGLAIGTLQEYNLQFADKS